LRLNDPVFLAVHGPRRTMGFRARIRGVRWASEPVESEYPKATGWKARRTGRFTTWLKCCGIEIYLSAVNAGRLRSADGPAIESIGSDKDP
jgi:hypothetical protein